MIEFKFSQLKTNLSDFKKKIINNSHSKPESPKNEEKSHSYFQVINSNEKYINKNLISDKFSLRNDFKDLINLLKIK